MEQTTKQASVYVLPVNSTPYLMAFEDSHPRIGLAHLKALVGGNIQMIPIPSKWTSTFSFPPHALVHLIVDEEGKFKDKPQNPFLPQLLHDTVVGNVLIALLDMQSEGAFLPMNERTAKQLYVQLAQFASGRRVD